MITTVKNSAQLLKALQTAHNGDTILLAAGSYSAVTLNKFNFTTGVTIASADPNHEAVLSNLTVSNSSGLVFKQLDLTTTTGTAATVSGSKNITFSQDTFAGSTAGKGNAMQLTNSSGVIVSGSSFSKFGTGINLLTDSNLTITNNTFHGITGGAIRGTSVTGSTISNNTFTDASTTVATHTDVLYLWQDNTANHVTISGNFYGPPLPNVLTTTTQLTEALQNAHAGQVIQLAAGVYDAATISGMQFATAVTITSADPTHQAVLTNLNVANSSGLTFQGVTFGTATGTAATVTGSQAIIFSGDTFSGPGAGAAMHVSGSTGVTVTGSDFGKFASGINATTDNNLSVTKNTFHDITGADVFGSGVTNSTVSGNTFTNANYTVPTHTDVLNLSQNNTANNVTLSNNIYPTAPVLTNAQLLMQALKNAHAGDVIKLAAGTYDGAVLSNLNFANGVTITSTDPTHEAVISNLTVSNSSGLAFEGVTLTTGTGAAATVTGSQNIAFSGDTFSGAGAGTALAVSGSSGVDVTGSDIGNFGTGLNLQTDSNVTVTGNNFHGNPGGGIVGAGVTASVIHGNTFPDASSTNTAHTDVINLAQDNTANQVDTTGDAYGSAHVVMVSNAQQLVTALQSAQGGDVIELAAGSYGDLAFSGMHFSGSGVTITSADTAHEAVVNSVAVWGLSSGINLDHLTVQLPSTGQYGIQVDGASNLNFSNMTVTGPGAAAAYNDTGILVRGGTNVSITHSDVDHFNTGIAVVSDDGLTISNNTFEDIGVGAVRGTGVTNSTISGNDFTTADPTVANHQDVLYLWQDNTANNVTYSGNTYGSGSTAVTDSSTPTGSTTTGAITATTPIVTTPIVTPPPPASSDGANVVTVSNAQQLMAAMQSAQGGEVIELAAGSYGDLAFSGMHFSGSGVTITSADTAHEAVVNSVAVWGLSSGINLDHLTVQLLSTGQYGIQVDGASNLNFSNMTVTGPGAAAAYNDTGILVRGGTNVSITHSDVDHFNTGIAVVSDDGLTISNNTFEDIGVGAVRGTGVTNSTISGNDFTTADPTVANHQDVLYLWQDNTANNVTYSGNTYGSGSTAVTDSSTPTGSTTTDTTTATTPIVTTPIVTPPPPASGDGANVVTVSNAQQLMAAMQSAQGGEVIKLAAGSYGDLAFSGMHFSGSGVTITSADTAHEAVVNSVALWGLSSGINLDHLTVQVPSTERYGIQVDGASQLNFSNLTITGTGSAGAYNGTGILVRGGTDVSITHSDVGQLNVGISVVDSNNVTVSHNAVHDLSQDGIDSAGSTNEVIQSNSFTNFSPGDGVHPDAIQFFADGNGVADSNILVADNVITRGTGSVFQGVFVENTNHIEITGNAMAGTMYNGVSLSTTDSALVSNNFVEGFTDMTSWIITRNVSSNVSVTNNQATAFENVADGGVANPNYSESGSTVIAQANVGDYTALNAWIAQHTPSTASLSDSFFLH